MLVIEIWHANRPTEMRDAAQLGKMMNKRHVEIARFGRRFVGKRAVRTMLS